MDQYSRESYRVMGKQRDQIPPSIRLRCQRCGIRMGSSRVVPLYKNIIKF